MSVFDKEKSDEAPKLAPLVPGKDKVEGHKVTYLSQREEKLETKPPSRISEAGLLSLMENAGRHIKDEELSQVMQDIEGLGTAATRADIIENLKYKEYVDAKLRPTVKGIRIVDVLERIRAEALTSAELTARLEKMLGEIEEGKSSEKCYIDKVIEMTKSVVESTRDFDYNTIYPNTDSLGKCPKCSRPVYEKAWFYGCEESCKPLTGKKECEFLVWKDFYGRYIDRTTVKNLLSNKITRELQGFTTPSGQIYSAKLRLDNNGQIVKEDQSQAQYEILNDIEINEEPLCPCPVHKDGCKIIETKTAFLCETKNKDDAEQGDPGFQLPRLICKRLMERSEALKLAKDGETELISNFVSKRGRNFTAKLVLKEKGGFEFKFPERQSKAKAKAKSEK